MKPARIQIDNFTINFNQESTNADPINLFLRRSIVNGAADAVAASIAAKRTTDTVCPDGAVINPTTGLMRAINPFGDQEFSWSEWMKKASEFRLGGYTDWRVATLKETFACTDHTRFKPAVDPNEYPDIVAKRYWTSTVDPESPSDIAFYVNFNHGTAVIDFQGFRGRALLVRSCVSAGSQ